MATATTLSAHSHTHAHSQSQVSNNSAAVNVSTTSVSASAVAAANDPIAQLGFRHRYIPPTDYLPVLPNSFFVSVAKLSSTGTLPQVFQQSQAQQSIRRESNFALGYTNPQKPSFAAYHHPGPSAASRYRSALSDRPHSIDELAEIARLALLPEVDFRNDLVLGLEYSEVYLKEAIIDHELGDVEMAFVNYARTVTMVSNKIPSHMMFMKLKESHRNRCAAVRPVHFYNKMIVPSDFFFQRGDKCLAQMDLLKLLIVERFETWRLDNPLYPLPGLSALSASLDMPRILNIMQRRDDDEYEEREESYEVKMRKQRAERLMMQKRRERRTAVSAALGNLNMTINGLGSSPKKRSSNKQSPNKYSPPSSQINPSESQAHAQQAQPPMQNFPAPYKASPSHSHASTSKTATTSGSGHSRSQSEDLQTQYRERELEKQREREREEAEREQRRREEVARHRMELEKQEARKREEEVAAARRKVEEEAAALAARRKSEEEAAKRRAEEEAAVQARRRAEEEAAAAKRKEEERREYERRVEEVRRIEEFRRRNEEMARKRAEEEAAAAFAAARKRAEEERREQEKRAEEVKKLEELRRKNEEEAARRRAEEEAARRRAEEDARRMREAEEARRKEEEQRLLEELKRRKQEEEAAAREARRRAEEELAARRRAEEEAAARRKAEEELAAKRRAEEAAAAARRREEEEAEQQRWFEEQRKQERQQEMLRRRAEEIQEAKRREALREQEAREEIPPQAVKQAWINQPTQSTGFSSATANGSASSTSRSRRSSHSYGQSQSQSTSSYSRSPSHISDQTSPTKFDGLPVLPLESPTKAVPAESTQISRLNSQPKQPTPQLALVSRAGGSGKHHSSHFPPITTTSPAPKERVGYNHHGYLSYPLSLHSTMSDHQRQQGYTPSLQSMFSAPLPTPSTGLLFAANHPEGPSSKNIPQSPDRPPAHVRHLWAMQSGEEMPARRPSPNSRIILTDQLRKDEMDNLLGPELRIVRVPFVVIERFLTVAAVNTAKRRETCGMLMGRYETRYNGVESKGFTVTTLLIPRQSGTSDSCAMLDEELVAEFAEKRRLMALGWIHTHPTQSCFMSSLDLHTHAGFQATLREFFAIVCSPPHFVPNCGVFRLTETGLMTINSCRDKAAFHPHAENIPIYTDADKGHVLWVHDPHLEIVDLR
ncbi:hypothetical protein Clacol_008965 [Clathrus columnatus]|uniref:MPN domain-containing protein n=1 Tax=Clathrus columnatus TaxID=1419009 RepID=A0AAV5APT5_9AGAM|nr:hypothetical protein Clacol_008965 [Clathrus columnatus]